MFLKLSSIFNKVIKNITDLLTTFGSSLVVQTVKNLPAVQETRVWSLSQEDPLETEMSTHSNTLVWRIPWTEEPGGLHSMGLQRAGHNWVTNTFTFNHYWLTKKYFFPIYGVYNLNNVLYINFIDYNKVANETT